jgi:hypothetical protein
VALRFFILHCVTPEHAKKLHQQPRHTTPRMRNNKIHTNRKENRGKDATPQKITIRPTHRKIET